MYPATALNVRGTSVRPITKFSVPNWYKNLVLETLIVCHAFWYWIFWYKNRLQSIGKHYTVSRVPYTFDSLLKSGLGTVTNCDCNCIESSMATGMSSGERRRTGDS